MRTNERKRSQINDLLIKPNTESTRVYPLKKIIVPFNFDKEKELSTKYTNIEQIMRDNIGINEKYRIHTSKDRLPVKNHYDDRDSERAAEIKSNTTTLNPLNKYSTLLGLDNLGNTCYM